jgi:short-subunit dehydrogenase
MGTQKRGRPLAVVTGASSGIGLELAKCCAKDGYDLLIAADDPAIHEAARVLGALEVSVDAVQADLSTTEGNDKLLAALHGRPIDALLANAGQGLGGAFLDQEWKRVRAVVDTNVTGTLYLLQQVGRQMRARKQGKILITGSIAGVIPGTYQAVYNSTKSFLDSFSIALRAELKDSGVTVTVLMPGATETRFFERAEMLDTPVGASEKQAASEVAETGYAAMKRGDADVVAGLKNKIQATLAHVTPATVLAEQHRKMAEPGGAKS